MIDFVIKASFLLFSAAVLAGQLYMLYLAGKIADAMAYEREMKEQWARYAAEANTQAWPFYDGEGIY